MSSASVTVKRAGLLRNAAVYTLANVANSAIPLVMLPLLTRVLSPQAYGVVSIFTTLLTAFGAFVGLSTHGAVNIRLFDSQTRHDRYIGTTFAILGVSTFCVLATTLLASTWLTGWTGLSQGWLALAVLAATAQFVVNIRLVVWQARGQAARYGAFQVSQTAVNLGLSLLLVFGLGLSWEGRVTGVVVALIAFAALAVVTLHRGGDVAWRFDSTYAKDALRFGLPLVPHVVGSLLIAASDRLMVAKLLSVHDAGIYTAGMQIGLIVGVLADAATKAIDPWLFSNLGTEDESVKRRIVRATYGFFICVLIVSAICCAAAPHLLTLVGKSFRSNPEVVAYVSLGSAFGCMYTIVVKYIFFSNRNELVAAASLFVGALNLVGTYVLVERNGAVGAAQSYAIAQLLLFLLIWSIAARCRPMPWFSALRRAPAQPIDPRVAPHTSMAKTP